MKKCSICRKREPVLLGIDSNGEQRFHRWCVVCKSRKLGTGSKSSGRVTKETPYRVHKGPQCEVCGFIPEHPCQLDCHHKDHNHSNNNPENIQTVCANCHRLITWVGRRATKKG